MPTGKPLTILFSGMIAGDPRQGGASWAILQYLLGFARLGHRVYFVEPVQPEKLAAETTSTDVRKYFGRIVRAFELDGRAALLAAGSKQTIGLSYAELVRIARNADVLFNVSGMLVDPELIGPIPNRVYLDLDPVFVQLWHAAENVDMRFAAHTHHVTVGLNIGTSACDIPTCGIRWKHTLPPVVLQYWPAHPPRKSPLQDALTTIGNWRAYGSVHHGGRQYGQKVHSLREMIDLPRRTPQRLALAMSIHPSETSDLELLRRNRWELLDPAVVASSPGRYRRFIQNSRGEIGIAKSGYVLARSGWISDRTVCYLASGRPVIAQQTGFTAHLPCGEGLLAFSTMEQAIEAIEQINRDYPRHCAAARRIAEEHFDSDRVLSHLLEMAEVAG
jgi:hypothetical protein